VPKSSKRPRAQSRQSARLHYFMMHVAPAPGSRFTRYGGAYVSCWVNFTHGEGALVLAKHYVRAEGWRIRKVEEHRFPSRNDYSRSPDLKYFDEASVDGSSFVYHRYPKRSSRSNTSLERTREE
jgi:hypothetical protein